MSKSRPTSRPEKPKSKPKSIKSRITPPPTGIPDISSWQKKLDTQMDKFINYVKNTNAEAIKENLKRFPFNFFLANFVPSMKYPPAEIGPLGCHIFTGEYIASRSLVNPIMQFYYCDEETAIELAEKACWCGSDNGHHILQTLIKCLNNNELMFAVEVFENKKNIYYLFIPS